MMGSGGRGRPQPPKGHYFKWSEWHSTIFKQDDVSLGKKANLQLIEIRERTKKHLQYEKSGSLLFI